MMDDNTVKDLARTDPVIWAMAHVRTEKGKRLDFVQHKFQLDVLEDYHHDIVIRKGSQVGMTTVHIVKIAFLMDTNPITVIYTFPTANDVNQFSAARYKPMLRSSEYLKDRMKDSVDNASLKQLGNSSIYFKGASIDSQAISIPADILIHDELDFSDQTVIEQYTSRLNAADSWKFKWKFSTPTLKDFGIDKEFKRSDQRRWIVKCFHCGKHQQVSYFKNIMTKKMDSSNFKRFWGCRRCGKELDRTRGEWVPKFQKKYVHGYFLPPTISPWITPSHLMRLHRTSKSLKDFFNFHLGLPYSTGVGLLTRDLLMKRVVPIRQLQGGSLYFMGVDQGDTLHIEVSKMSEGGLREVVWYGTTKDFNYLDVLMERFDIHTCVIDALPNKHSAKDFASKFPGRVKIAYYQYLKLKEQKEYKDGEEPDSIIIDFPESLDNSAEQWVRNQAFIYAPDDNFIKKSEFDLPKGESGWIQQMCNMKRGTEEDANGNMNIKWTKDGPDHYRHADNYNYIAWKLNKWFDFGDVESATSGISKFDPLRDNFNPTPALVGATDMEEEILVAASRFQGFEEEDI